MRSLRGRSILVTRAAEDAEPWARRIRELGAEPVFFPCIDYLALVDDATRERLRDAVSRAHWVVFSSKRGVAVAAHLLSGSVPETARLAAVGPRTGREVRLHFGRLDLEGDGSGGRALAGELASALVRGPTRARDQRVIFPCADRARHDLEEVLEPLGVEVVRIPVYRTVVLGPEAPGIDLTEAGVDVVLLASPSAVESLVQRTTVPHGTVVISIGPTTSEAARARGLEVTAEASRPDLEGLLEAIP